MTGRAQPSANGDATAVTFTLQLFHPIKVFPGVPPSSAIHVYGNKKAVDSSKDIKHHTSVSGLLPRGLNDLLS